MLMTEEDRIWIENKYHNTKEPYNAYNRMAYHGHPYDPSTGMDDDEMAAGLQKIAEESKTLPHPVAKARGFRYIVENARIMLDGHDWYLGFYNWGRLLDKPFLNPWVDEILRGIGEKNDLKNLYDETGAVAIWPDFDHVIPNWGDLLTLGFPGLLARVESYHADFQKKGITEKQEAFFCGMEETYRGILNLIDRYRLLSERLTHEKAALQQECFAHLSVGAPTNTYEALQAMFLFFMVCECVDHYQTRSMGNGIDRTLLPFAEADLASGKFTGEEIKSFMAYYFMQFSAIGNYWGHPMYLGGTKPDGSTRVNMVSYWVLEIYEELTIYNPKVQIKVAKNTPKDFLYRVFDLLRKGISSFVFCCETGMQKALQSYGATPEEALDFEISGCYETRVRGDESSTSSGYVNMLKGVELLLHDGCDFKSGRRVVTSPEALEKLESFEDFYFAYLGVIRELIEKTVSITNAFEEGLDEMNPSNVYSPTVERSLKRGVDGYSRGVKFNNCAMLCCGFATAVDALMAVKKLVFEEKFTTLKELKKALDQNWEGYEELRAKALSLPEKYGNHQPETDRLATGLARYFADHVNGVRNARGGVYKAIMHTAMMFVWQGEKTAATPDGRKAGEEMSKNASPTNGMDRKGATALIQSAYSLIPSLFAESFCVDVMLHPSAVEGEDGLVAMDALLTTYLNHDGMSIQFNIFNADTLRDAQAHPDKYRNLQVRVCGWNVLWNDIPRIQQDAYILRAMTVVD